MNLADANLDDIISALPASVVALMQAISPQGALRLVDKFGGTPVFVPGLPNADSRLNGCLSGEDFANLCRHYGGYTLWLPRCGKALRLLRDRQLASDSQRMTLPELALKYRMTVRGVIYALDRMGGGNPARDDLECRQMSVFGEEA